MVRALARACSAPDDRVLVIDDNSPDGTGEIADRLAAELACVDGAAPRRKKEGLGPAYIAGFRRALAARRRARAGDGLRLLARPRRRAAPDRGRRRAPTWCSARATSAAAASRTGASSGALISRGGSPLRAGAALGVPVRDLTGGFKCFRREVLEAIDLDAVSARGYAFQIETTYRALRAGFRVVEMPITFVDREAGSSKMSRAIVLEAIWRVPYLGLLALRGRLR